MKFYYNPLDKKCKSILGAVPCNTQLTLNVYASEGKECFLEINADGQSAHRYPMLKTDFGWKIVLDTKKIGLFFYRFFADGIYYGRGAGRIAQENADDGWQLTVYDEKFCTPEWFKGGTMYQIFPDRFAKKGEITIEKGKNLRDDWGGLPEFRPDKQGIVQNNDFFGGNIQGIIDKLDYLQSLHITTVYLNPIFKAYSNHRYDTGDYKKIDPLLGDLSDFRQLVCEAEKRGIRLVLDGVFNHTGDDSLYFNKKGTYDEIGAYQSKNAKYYDWYNFYDYPDGYDAWWGIKTLPAVNEHSESYQNFIMGEDGVLKTWLKEGIGGYRLDVADELPDFFLEKLRKAVKEENPDALIIGEVWEDASNKIAYGQRRQYFQGNELDSVMNYPLKEAIIDFVTKGSAGKLVATIGFLIDNYPKCVLDCLMNILSTHDTCRILTVCGGVPAYSKEEMAGTFLTEEEKKSAIEKVKRAALLQFTLFGVPCVYYGDENGMEGYSDPFCRRCFDWEHLNEDLIGFYRKLGKIRKEHRDVFRDGEYIEVYHDDTFLFYARANRKKRIYVYENNGSKRQQIALNGVFTDLITGKTLSKQLTVEPYSYGIFLKN